jgi:hypothetical protein
MSAAKKSSSSARKTSARKKDPVEETTERIRQINEQVLDFGRTAGVVYLEAYESTLKMFGDYHDEIARSIPNESLASLAHAQASFVREVVQAYASSSREFLK